MLSTICLCCYVKWSHNLISQNSKRQIHVPPNYNRSYTKATKVHSFRVLDAHLSHPLATTAPSMFQNSPMILGSSLFIYVPLSLSPLHSLLPFLSLFLCHLRRPCLVWRRDTNPVSLFWSVCSVSWAKKIEEILIFYLAPIQFWFKI